MALTGSQLGAFNSVRYLIGKVDAVVTESKGRVEDEIRRLVALGDTFYYFRNYQKAVEYYLQAYSAAYRYLHPRFPVISVAAQPGLLLKLDALDAIVEAVAFNARYRHVDGLPPTVAPFNPPDAVKRVAVKNQVGKISTTTNAGLHFESAMNLLAVGELNAAETFLNSADRSNTGRIHSKELSGRISLGRASVQLARGKVREAGRALDSAATAFRELGQNFAERVVRDNKALIEARTGASNTSTGGTSGTGRPRIVDRTFARRVDLSVSSRPAVARNLVQPVHVTSFTAARFEVGTIDAGTLAVHADDEFVIPLEAGRLVGVDLAAAEKTTAATSYQVMTMRGSIMLNLKRGGAEITEKLLATRVGTTDVVALWPRLDLVATFLAYIPHVYGFVLPMSIGDCYSALGRRSLAVDYYLKALSYPHLNVAIEGAHVWLRAARAIVAEGDHLFKARREEEARVMYESVVDSAGSVPQGSRLYAAPAWQGMRSLAAQAVQAINTGTVFGSNPLMAALVAHARAQLTKIDAGLNWLGIAVDVVPIWTFDFLQSSARYFAQHAIQAWRQYISYRSAAEQEEMTQLELEQAIVLNEYAESTQQARVDLADAQVEVSEALRDGAELHRDNLVDQRDQFNTDGWVIAELNRFQAWYGNVNLDNTFEAGHWDWGGGHELSIGETSGQEAIDAVMRYRNRLSHQMQIDNFNRQIAEANNQITVANRQVEVANAQAEVSRLELAAAQQRTEYARQNLDFFENQEFTPDLWHALAHAMGEVAEDYLNMGIHAAFLMERAYNVEHDRNLQRIRFDYPDPGGAAELTAGDSLLLDIDSFTHDLLMSVKGRHNQVRHVISLADFAPQAYQEFLQTGVMEFTIPIDEVERAYPGTYLHRIQNVEVEIEGLQVPEGINGSLEHLGISTWRRSDGSTESRVSAPESLVLSGYNLRRDMAFFRVDPSRLKVFENSGTAASWRLRLPRDSNDVDFSTIFDVRLVLYFLCRHDPQLEADIRAAFPAGGEAAQGFSARLHAPDEFFMFGPDPDGSDTITFSLSPRAFPFNQRNLVITELGVLVLRDRGQDPPEPFTNVPLSVTLDGNAVAGTTNANGVIHTDSGAGDLAAFIGENVGDVAVQFTGPDAQRAEVGDVHLFLNYSFDYR